MKIYWRKERARGKENGKMGTHIKENGKEIYVFSIRCKVDPGGEIAILFFFFFYSKGRISRANMNGKKGDKPQ